jgi:hypothetical protein
VQEEQGLRLYSVGGGFKDDGSNDTPAPDIALSYP